MGLTNGQFLWQYRTFSSNALTLPEYSRAYVWFTEQTQPSDTIARNSRGTYKKIDIWIMKEDSESWKLQSFLLKS